MTRRPPTLRQRILEVLADGRPRRSDRLAQEIHDLYGFSIKTVTATLSFFAFYRGVERVKVGPFYQYRRVDIEAPAA